MYENIKKVGLPAWSDDDQTLAKALQRELKVPVRGLASKIPELRAPRSQSTADDDSDEAFGPGPTGGGSDDIGDVSWVVPTVRLATRPTFPAVPVTTGPTRFPWPRPSPTKA